MIFGSTVEYAPVLDQRWLLARSPRVSFRITVPTTEPLDNRPITDAYKYVQVISADCCSFVSTVQFAVKVKHERGDRGASLLRGASNERLTLKAAPITHAMQDRTESASLSCPSLRVCARVSHLASPLCYLVCFVYHLPHLVSLLHLFHAFLSSIRSRDHFSMHIYLCERKKNDLRHLCVCSFVFFLQPAGHQWALVIHDN